MSIRYMSFYICLGVFIVLAGRLYNPVLYFFIIAYVVLLFYKVGYKGMILCISVVAIYNLTMLLPPSYSNTTVKGRIIDRSEKYIVVKVKQAKVKAYGKVGTYQIGDDIDLEVVYFPIANNRNKNVFSYPHYLQGKGIMQQGKIKKVHRHKRRYTFFSWLQERINSQPSVSPFVSTLVLGIKSSEMEEIYNTLTNLSLLHLFSLSGRCIYSLRRWLKNILRFMMPERWVMYTSLSILGLYVYSIPEHLAFRLAYLVLLIQTLAGKRCNKLDALCLGALVLLFFNPYRLYQISFVFSFVARFFSILLGRCRYKGCLLYLSIIPVLLLLQFRLPITASFLSWLCLPIVSALYSACWWYLLLGRILLPFLQVGIYCLESIILFCSQFPLYLNFSKPTIFFIGMYYYLFIKIVIKSNHRRTYRMELIKLLCVLCIFFVSSRFSLSGKVVMIDVGQGDSFLIKQPFDQGTIMIDTGGLRNRDVAKDSLIPYLRSEGIFTLDYVFISHDDFDHCGALESLQKEIHIKHVIRTPQPPITLGDIHLTMYPLELDTKETNANSLIFKVELPGISYLFTGDIGQAEEILLQQKYGNIPVDVLKVAHHGSKNSTSYQLLEATQPKVALISSGQNNRYNHPHPIVIEKLQRYGVHIYRSDTMGMVTIWYFGKEHYIFT